MKKRLKPFLYTLKKSAAGIISVPIGVIQYLYFQGKDDDSKAIGRKDIHNCSLLESISIIYDIVKPKPIR